MLSLGTRADVKPSTSQQAVLFCSQHYSQDFQTCIVALLKKTPANVHEMFRLASVHVADELDMSMASADALHGHLCNEYENGRLLRLLLKLGTINERPGHALDPQWAETGDRYVLKLFRDYTFHQVSFRAAFDGASTVSGVEGR
jgi:PAB-dependent poly(A)-specific ribonuclease subunit 3